MFKKAIVGGTFDHFHKGHKRLIEHGLSRFDRIIATITSDGYVKKKSEDYPGFENFEIRKKEVSDFLVEKASGRFEIIKIDDVFGPTLNQDFDVQAIVVTNQTQKGADLINEKRKKKNLPALEISICPLDQAEDGELISSEKIRSGEIDREGRLYIKPEWLEKTLYTTEEAMPDLKKPFGTLLQSIDAKDLESFSGKIFSVGDESTKFLKSLGINPSVSIVDFKVARVKKFSNLSDLGFSGKETVLQIKNPPGTINPDLFKIASQLTRGGKEQESVVLIDGEDDLSVLPITLASPLGNYIFYGQPNEGIVKVLIDEKHKAKAAEIVARFTTRGH